MPKRDPEKQRQYQQKWAKTHYDAWYKKNRQKIRAERRKNYLKNREKVLRELRTKKVENARKARLYYQRHREQCMAQSMLRQAVRKGKINRPYFCQNCGVIGKPHGHHHRGYSKEHWLDVIWLCSVCHGLETAKDHDNLLD